MVSRAASRTRVAIALALGLVASGTACSSTSSGNFGTARNFVTRKPATFIGPLLSSDETPTITLGRDGGITVPLPNGKILWIFGDTPTYRYEAGAWKLTAFIEGSSAGLVSYTPGKRPTLPVDELAIGQQSTKATPAAQFLAPPTVYLPDGSGKICNKENGGPTAGSVRWATGAALLADRTNVFVPYIDACVISALKHQPEGWGFAIYNWKTNRFTVPPTDVFVPKKSGEAISSAQYFGSPIVSGHSVTMFSATCCKVGSSVYSTTLSTTLAALKNPKSYFPNPILGLPATFLLTVAPPTVTHPYLTMYELTSVTGGYRIFSSSKPEGPWVDVAEGTLPKCASSPAPCNNSIYLHPELSSPKELLASYWLPGYGPGIGRYPDKSRAIYHIVFASLPL